jgi:hypothetical protein
MTELLTTDTQKVDGISHFTHLIHPNNPILYHGFQNKMQSSQENLWLKMEYFL